jgi:plasmid replication initiation protein
MRIKGTNAYKGRNGIVYKAMRELRGKHLDLYDEKGRAFNTGWFSKVKMENDNDTVYYSFDSDLMPYLFNLRLEMGGLSITTMEMCCALETPQGVRLYLFLRSIAYKGMRQRIDLDTIRERTGNAGLYEAYKDLRVRVLTPAIEDINKYADMEVSYNEVRQGKKVVALDFTIKDRRRLTADELFSKEHNRNMLLYGAKNPNRTYKKVANTKYVNPFRKANSK